MVLHRQTAVVFGAFDLTDILAFPDTAAREVARLRKRAGRNGSRITRVDNHGRRIMAKNVTETRQLDLGHPTGPHRIKMRAFIEYLADTDVQILVYSRMEPDTLARSYRDMLGDVPRRFPALAGRLHTFSLVAHGTPHWKDPATAAALKVLVKQLLQLE